MRKQRIITRVILSIVGTIFLSQCDMILPAFPPRMVWETPVLLGGGVSSPRVSCDSNGNAVAVWVQNYNSYESIFADYYNAAEKAWQGAVLLENISGYAKEPQIAMDGSGNAMAVWYQYDGSYSSIYGNYYDAVEEAWQGSVLLENNSGEAAIPLIAMDGSGNAMTVWHQYDGSYKSIYANYWYAVEEAWQGSVLLENNSGEAAIPLIAMDGSGNAMTVWAQSDGSYKSIYANYWYAVEETWQGTDLLENNLKVNGLQIAIDGFGNAVAVWTQYDGKEYSIMSNRYIFDAGWDQIQNIYKVVSNKLISPDIVIDCNGDCFAVWSEYSSTFGVVWACRGRLQ